MAIFNFNIEDILQKVTHIIISKPSMHPNF